MESLAEDVVIRKFEGIFNSTQATLIITYTNLQITTDIIIYHRFDKKTEEQIKGRGQRIGRYTPLNIYYLLHDNEDNIIDDDFE